MRFLFPPTGLLTDTVAVASVHAMGVLLLTVLAAAVILLVCGHDPRRTT